MARQRRNKQIKNIKNVDLEPDEIETILDAASIADEIVDFLAKKYHNEIENNDAYRRIRDIIDVLDLTKQDETELLNNLSEAAKRSFFSLMTSGELSRPEVIFYVKNNFATDIDIQRSFEKTVSHDLASIVLHWRPQLFETVLCKYCRRYHITAHAIEESKQRLLCIEKFKFLAQ